MTDPTSLQDLVDRQAICDVLLRYCHGCDHMDEAGLRRCFHADATHDHGGYVGPTGPWIEAALLWLDGRQGVTHMVTNPLIRIEGDRAVSDCHFVAYNRLPGAGGLCEEVLVKGRYVDRFERRGAEWKIRHRLGIHDFEQIRTIAAPPEPTPGTSRSGPASQDPYFAVLADFLAGG